MRMERNQCWRCAVEAGRPHRRLAFRTRIQSTTCHGKKGYGMRPEVGQGHDDESGHNDAAESAEPASGVQVVTPALPPEVDAEAHHRRSAVLHALARKAYLLLVIAAVVIVGAKVSPFFLTSRNINSTLITASSVVVLAIGQFIVIVTGGIDLSVGSTAALASVVGALMMQGHGSPAAAVIVCLALGAAVGFVNGVVIVFGRITPFIATLGMLNVASGLAYLLQTGDLVLITNNRFITFFTGSIGGLASPIIISLIVLVVAAVVMAGTPLGRRLYALGGNPEAARLSGLPVKVDLLKAYSISGMLAALAGLMISAQLAEGSAIIGSNYELAAIAAAVVGGASLFGGRGDPVGAALGALAIGGITDIMQLRGVASQSQLLIQGVVILVAVFFVSGGGGPLVKNGARGLSKIIRSAQTTQVGRNFPGK
ncbi:MAG: ABC transporter permease [Streptosporangiaceae bacterium]